MDDSIYLIIILVIGIIIGWNMREAMARRRIERMLDSMSSDTFDSILENIINVRCEFHDDGLIFIYDREKGTYLGHAENAEKLTTMMTEKFPGKYFNVTPEDLEKLEAK